MGRKTVNSRPGTTAAKSFKGPPGVKRSSADGAQAIKRAVTMLRLVARHGAKGLRLVDLKKMSALTHATSYRILQCLVNENLVCRNPINRRYQLGLLNYELALATPYRPEFQDTLRPQLQRIAEKTEETVYLIGRSGSDSVCLDRIDGAKYIRSRTIEIGDRRPLCFGASGIAILSTLDEEEVEEVLTDNAVDIRNHPRLNAKLIREAIIRSRAHRYSLVRDTSVIGVGAVGIALSPMPNRPMLGVSVSTTNNRLSSSRAQSISELLFAEFENALT
jgi:DNA-binding IclR family transcriptional regulator